MLYAYYDGSEEVKVEFFDADDNFLEPHFNFVPYGENDLMFFTEAAKRAFPKDERLSVAFYNGDSISYLLSRAPDSRDAKLKITYGGKEVVIDKTSYTSEVGAVVGTPDYGMHLSRLYETDAQAEVYFRDCINTSMLDQNAEIPAYCCFAHKMAPSAFNDPELPPVLNINQYLYDLSINIKECSDAEYARVKNVIATSYIAHVEENGKTVVFEKEIPYETLTGHTCVMKLAFNDIEWFELGTKEDTVEC